MLLILACASAPIDSTVAAPAVPTFSEVTVECDRGQASLKDVPGTIVNVWQCQNTTDNPLCTNNNIYWWRDASGTMTFFCSDGDTIHVLTH